MAEEMTILTQSLIVASSSTFHQIGDLERWTWKIDEGKLCFCICLSLLLSLSSLSLSLPSLPLSLSSLPFSLSSLPLPLSLNKWLPRTNWRD